MNDQSVQVNNPTPSRGKVRRLLIKDILRENVPWLLLAAIMVLFSFLFPQFLTFRNITNIFRNSALVGIVAIGMTFAMIGGTFDLSVGTVLGLATVITIQMQPTTPVSAFYIVLIAMASGALVGVLNGLVVGRWRTNSIVTTIGTSLVVLGVTLVYTQGQHISVENMYAPLAFIGTGRIYDIPFPIFIFIGVAIIGQLILSTTRFGRHLYATGGNATTAMLSGINVGMVRILAYMISGLAAAIGGIMIAARTQYVDPSFGVGMETDVLTCVLLGGVSLYGGRGTVIGTVAGVLLLHVITNAMTLSGISYEFQLMIRGIILVLTVAVNVVLQKRG
jgi:ribose/xylose/arabinose/galactoside ABC-type transport system permease subunit